MSGIDWVIEKLEEHPELYINDKDQDVLYCEILYYLRQFKKIVELPDGEEGEITLIVRKKTYQEHIQDFVSMMKTLEKDQKE